MQAQQAEIVKCLFKMAWADGEASEEEVEVLSRLMTRLGIPLSERIIAMDGGLSEPEQGQDHIEDLLPDRESRLQAMEMLLAVCFSDQQLAPQEVSYIEDLSRRLGISAPELEALRQRAMGVLG